MPDLVIVTGEPGEGKTRAIRQSAALLGSQGRTVAGIVQPARLDRHGRRAGYYVEDLRSARRVPLADAVGSSEGEFGTRFRFHARAFEFAAARLESRDAEILMVDELGPVEMRGGGHGPALRRALRLPSVRVLVVGVRPALVESCIAWVRPDSVAIVRVGDETDPSARVAQLAGRLVGPSRRPSAFPHRQEQ